MMTNGLNVSQLDIFDMEESKDNLFTPYESRTNRGFSNELRTIINKRVCESTEIWKEIDNYSNYEISSYGNLRNKTTNCLLTPNIKGGYLCTTLTNDNNKRDAVKIHRLVALTFIPNPENKPTVNHKDHNRTNNVLSNLEWATVAEQNRHKRKPNREIQRLISSRKVWRINIDTNEKIELYETIRDAAQWIFDNNLTTIKDFNGGNNIKTKICAVCQKHKDRKTAFGFKWEYDKDENNNIGEEWKDIPSDIVKGTKGYKISNLGRVKNHKGRITEGSVHPSGYLWVSVYPYQYLLHRLVAKVFIPNPENKEQVNHIDGNKENASVNNLEWNTNQENQIHAVETGLKPGCKRVIQYDLKMNKINEFKSIKKASEELEICVTSISKCCLNKQKTAGGSIFKCAE